MKKILFILFGVFLANLSYSQIWFHHIVNQNKIEKKYGFKLQKVKTIQPSVDTPFQRTIISDVSLCKKRWGVLSLSNNQINFDIWKLNDSTTCGQNGIDSSIGISTLRFTDTRVTYGRPTLVMWVPFQSINLGLNTLPYRRRNTSTQNNGTTIVPSQGTSAFSLAFNAGYTFGWSQITTRAITNWSLTLGGYFGPSTADLRKETVENPSTWITNQTNATINYGFNLILARNNLGLVFAYGIEKAIGSKKEQWIYNNVPYFGFGINTSFMR